MHSITVLVHVSYLTQSPSNAFISDGVSENPNLKDNWDDAEGYYRKLIVIGRGEMGGGGGISVCVRERERE